MGKDRRNIQKSRAKKRARREKKKREQRQQQRPGDSTFVGVSKSAIRNAPILDALVSKAIFEKGMGPVAISRTLSTGEVAMGVFLVDCYCLGVKDAFYTLRSASQHQEDIDRIGGADGLDRVDPAYARKFVEGAVAYAADLGFKAHGDYRKAAVVLGDIDSEACDETFEYGRDGKPLYVSGPYDSPQKIERIMAVLKTRCGEDGFHYMVQGEEPDLT